MRDTTRVIRAGIPPTEQGSPFLPPPTFAGTYHATGDPNQVAYTYGRYHNPTWTHFENALSELEGGQTILFASGMAAITAVYGTVLRPGDVVVMPSQYYYITSMYTNGYFAQMGIQIRISADFNEQDLVGAKLLWLESPSNPYLDVIDLARLAAIAHQHGVLVAVDNTIATALGQQPLALGADFSVASDTKALTGHSDLILGHVSVRDQALAESLRAWRTQTGAVPGPMEVWLAHRSLGTLALRMERQSANALALAKFLSQRPEVSAIYYPGLQDNEIVRQLRYSGSVLSFTLADQAAAEKFLSRCQLVDEATSFGGLHSTAERRVRWGGDLPAGFIRMSAGCEAIEDLLADITQALDSL